MSDNTAEIIETTDEQPIYEIIQPPDNAEDTPEGSRQHARRNVFLVRKGTLVFMLFLVIAGTFIGTLFGKDTSLPADVLTNTGGGFFSLLARRLLCTGTVLAAEYVLGYFAAGNYFVGFLPFAGGLGAGVSLAGVYCTGGFMTFLPLLPCAAAFAIITAFGADASAEFSTLLMRMVTGGKNSIVMTSYAAARAYTVRFLAYFTLLLGFAIYEAAFKVMSL